MNEPFGSKSGARMAEMAVIQADKRLKEIAAKFAASDPGNQSASAAECITELANLFSTLAPLARKSGAVTFAGTPDPHTLPERKLCEAVHDMNRRVKTPMFPHAKGSRGNQPLDSGAGRARVLACVAAKLFQKGGMTRTEAFAEACSVARNAGYVPSEWDGPELEDWFDNELPKSQHAALLRQFKSYGPLIDHVQADIMVAGQIARNMILMKI